MQERPHTMTRRRMLAGTALLAATAGAGCAAPEDVWNPQPERPPGLPGLGLPLDPDKIPDPEYVPLLEDAAAHCHGIDAPLLAAQIDAESNWNPRAQSPAGAQGIAQFMPATWAAWGYDANGDGVADVWDPQDAIPSQGRFMCAMHTEITTAQERGDLPSDPTSMELALAAYNAGLNAVLQYRGIPPYPETQAYIPRIMSRRQHYAAPWGTPPIDGYHPAPVGCPSTGNPFEDGLLASTIRVLRCVQAVHGNQIISSGWRPGGSTPNSDHPLGLAIDTHSVAHWNTPQGIRENWLLAHWAQVNADRLGISYLIFHNYTWQPHWGSDAWTPYDHDSGVSNPDLDHHNHVHLSVRAHGGDPDAPMRPHAPRVGTHPRGIWLDPAEALGL